MGGIFGVASKTSCTMDLFFGIDYHSHLGTRRGGMAVYGENGFQRAIHNIENTPFRTKFDHDLDELEGTLGIGCISDMDPQPLLIRSHLGTYALTTVGVIRNPEELIKEAYKNGHVHFMSMSGGKINDTELVASLIDQKDSLVERTPLRPGADPGLHVHASPDAGRHLRLPGPLRPYPHHHRPEGRGVLRFL